MVEWEALPTKEKVPAAEWLATLDAERQQPTVKAAIDSLMQKIMAGKKSAPAIRYRLDRLG